MFNKLKQIQELKSQANQLKKSLAEEVIEATAMGGKIKITIDGNQEIKSVNIDPSVVNNINKVEAGVKDAVNDAIKKAQKAMAQKISQMGSFNFPGL